MSGPRIGSLFSGYGGLEQGVQAAIGGTTAWVSDIDKGACKILAHRYPDVPNLGDISTVDWTTVEPVDVLTGGFPCQDVSHAGKRAGMRPDTRTGLWSQMAYAIDQLRPALVVAENVRGLLSAKAHSDLEPCPWCMGDGAKFSALRALGAVLGDLADIGYDACWYGLRAADIGAAHGRFRVFVVAYPAGDAGRFSHGDGGAAPASGDSKGSLLPTPATSDTNGAGAHGDGGLDLRTAVAGLLPTPIVSDSETSAWDYGPRDFTQLRDIAHLLPTPAVNDMGAAYTPDEWDAWTGRMKAEHGNGNGHGKSLSIEAQLLGTPTARNAARSQRFAEGRNLSPVELALLPTPRTENNENRQSEGYGGGKDGNFHELVNGTSDWGAYADAIARWEHTLGRPAPAPTMTSTKGNPQLSPAFVEWLMGLPAGWVTDVPGITRNEALKALGNGVVPAQAEAAVRHLLTVTP